MNTTTVYEAFDGRQCLTEGICREHEERISRPADFHIFDCNGHEISRLEPEAFRVAAAIIDAAPTGLSDYNLLDYCCVHGLPSAGLSYDSVGLYTLIDKQWVHIDYPEEFVSMLDNIVNMGYYNEED